MLSVFGVLRPSVVCTPGYRPVALHSVLISCPQFPLSSECGQGNSEGRRFIMRRIYGACRRNNGGSWPWWRDLWHFYDVYACYWVSGCEVTRRLPSVGSAFSGVICVVDFKGGGFRLGGHIFGLILSLLHFEFSSILCLLSVFLP